MRYGWQNEDNGFWEEGETLCGCGSDDTCGSLGGYPVCVVCWEDEMEARRMRKRAVTDGTSS